MELQFPDVREFLQKEACDPPMMEHSPHHTTAGSMDIAIISKYRRNEPSPQLQGKASIRRGKLL
jgi:hypothetical protein